MDDYEATRIVFSRVQNLDPENASKIMGLILLQDHGEKEMIRLAFGPEALIHSIVLKAKTELKFTSSRPKINHPALAISNPDDFFIAPQNFSAAACGNGGGGDGIDELPLKDQLSFENPDFFYPPPPASPTGGDRMFAGGWSDEVGLGLGWRPCLYFARGYCKNGGSCRFSHSGGGELGLKSTVAADGGGGGGRADVVEQCSDFLLRSKSALQQRLAAAAFGNCNFFPYSPPAASDFLLQQQQNEMRRYRMVFFFFK